MKRMCRATPAKIRKGPRILRPVEKLKKKCTKQKIRSRKEDSPSDPFEVRYASDPTEAKGDRGESEGRRKAGIFLTFMVESHFRTNSLS